ncbi:MAG: hypothetical protein H8K04_14655 [Nitrospira sp.]
MPNRTIDSFEPVSFAHPISDTSKRAAMCRLVEASHALTRARRAFTELKREGHDRLDDRVLSRLQRRVDAVATLTNDVVKDLKLLGIDKKAPFIEVTGERVSLQDISRRVSRIQKDLREKKVDDSFGEIVDAITDPDDDNHPGRLNPTGFWGIFIVAIAKAAVAVASGALNDTTDDEARKLIGHALPEDLERMEVPSLIKLLNDLCDGSTWDDDERAILKVLRALSNNCSKMGNVVKGVGLDKLLWCVDGEEWDEMVIVLLKCGLISFKTMDDDASRLFVTTHTYYQLSHLHIGAVHQLILNMFAGSCGDDDEQAILKLVGSQVAPKLHQLIAMPGTDVGAFDYNFDGDEWDTLEALFAANGIVLDP